MHLAGLIAAVAGGVAEAATRGHVTGNDVEGLLCTAASNFLMDNGIGDKDVLQFHPHVDHPDHPDPNQRGNR